MIFVILGALFLILLYRLSIKSYDHWKNKNVAYEKPYPIFGNMLNVAMGREAVGATVKRLYDTLDENLPYFGMYIFHIPYLVVRDPEMIKNVLIKDFSSFSNRKTFVNKSIDPIFSNFLFSLRNEEWKDLRNKLTPIFTSGKMKMMLPLMKEVTDELERYMQEFDGKEIDAKDISKRYTIDTISSCAFGINSNSIKNENSVIRIMVNNLLDTSNASRAFAGFSYLFCPIFVKIFRFTFTDRKACDYLVNVFKDTSNARKQMNIKRHDLIDCLHSIEERQSEEDVFQLDVLKMSAQAIVFFNAGSDPSTLVISFLLYELALNVGIQKELRKEIRENINNEGSILYDTLNEMKYLDMVTKETLRKYPITQLIFRETEVDYTFEETGLKLEKGTPVLIPMSALHFDPKYFPRPELFDPERFREDRIKDKYTFIPFGDGPRKCIGERFAIMQIKIAVAMMLKNFEVTPSKNTEVPLKLSKISLLLMPESGKIHLNIKRIS